MKTIIKYSLSITFLVAATNFVIANGFISSRNTMKKPATIVNVATEVSNDFGSKMPKSEEIDPHVTIGVEPEKLAIGIDPSKFLELIGTKEELKEKFQSDNTSWDSTRVEVEVDRFMMDAENVNMYLKYLTDKIENPEKYAAQALEAELSLSNPKTAATYLAWLVGGVSIGIFRTEYLAPKLESGEWHLPSFLSN